MTRHSLIPAGALALMIACGCGGGFIKGTLLSPPAMPEADIARHVDSAPVPAHEGHRVIRPLAVRAYPTGEVVVDVVVVQLAVEPSWSGKAGNGFSDDQLVWRATFSTNGLNVPAHLHSSGRAGATIELRGEDEEPIVATRAILGEPSFESLAPELNASTRYTDNVQVRTVRRAGRPWSVCIVPVLLSTDQPVRPGDAVDVRIAPSNRDDPWVDQSWYRMRVGEVSVVPGSAAMPTRSP
jgi:hypothetical protein